MRKACKKSHFLKNRGTLAFYITILAFPVLQFCVFYIGVNFNSILLAFKSYDTLTGNWSYAGLGNFSQFIVSLKTSGMNHAIINSIILYLANLFIALPIALFFSYYIFKKVRGYNTARIFLFLPSILSNIVMAILFNNIVALILPELGLKDYLSTTSTQFGSIVFFNLWVGFGASTILYSGAMSQTSDELLEAAKIDGAREFRQFWNIVLPSIFPTISTFLVTGIAGIFINQASIYSFFAEIAPERSITIGYYFFVKVVRGQGGLTDYTEAAAAGILMTLIAAPLTLLVKHLLERFGPSPENRTRRRELL